VRGRVWWRGSDVAARKTEQDTTFDTALPRAGNIAESWQKGCSEALVKRGHNPITSEDALGFSGVRAFELVG
jgi:hypothetical protein